MKNIILFVDQESGSRGRLFLKCVQKRLSGTQIQVSRNVDAFAAAVRRISPWMGTPIVVLFVVSKKNMDHLYLHKPFFENSKIAMVLPEEKTEAFTDMAHRFFPRYVAAMDDRYDNLCDVLNKMLVQ